MAATASIDAIEWLRKQVEAAPDGLRTMLTQMVNLLIVSSENSVRSHSGNSGRSPDEASALPGNTAARSKKRSGRGKGCST